MNHFVGLLLWRRGVLGQEVLALEHDGRLVLPKGSLREGEDEPDAIDRMAAAHAGVRGTHPTHLLNDILDLEGRQIAVSWWSLRWTGPADAGASQASGRSRWMGIGDARIHLTHPVERALADTRAKSVWARLVEWAAAPRARRLQRRVQTLEDQRSSLLARPERGGQQAGWRALALEQLERARGALAEDDLGGYRRALAHARRHELFGMDSDELELSACELASSAAAQLGSADAAYARQLLEQRPPEAARLAHAADLLNRLRAEQDSRREATWEERCWLLTLIALALPLALLSGTNGVGLSTLVYGLLGGAFSALSWPREAADASVRVLARPLLGALAALIVTTLFSSGALHLGSSAVEAWALLAFAAGFLERWVGPRRA